MRFNMKKIKLNKITGIIIISTLTLFLIVSQSQADVDEEFFRFEQEFLLKVEQGYDLLDLYEIKESIKSLYQTDRNKAIILLQDAWDILKQAKLFNASEIYKQVISKKAYKADRFKIILAYEVFGVEVHIVSYYSNNLKQYGVIHKPLNAKVYEDLDQYPDKGSVKELKT